MVRSVFFILLVLTLKQNSAFAIFGGHVPPQIGVDSLGNEIAVWESNFQIFYSTKPVLGLWATAQPLSDEGVLSKYPKIVMNSSGNTLAVWVARDPTLEDKCLHAATKTLLGGWSAIERISGTDTERLYFFNIKLTDAGEILVAWSKYKESANEYSVYVIGKAFGDPWPLAPTKIYDP